VSTPAPGIAPLAVLVGLVVLGVALCALAIAPDPGWRLGYSDPDLHDAPLAALELELASMPLLAGAPPHLRQDRLQAPAAPSPGPDHAPVVTRDRSPPAP
jgi:hypothetical protein